MVSWKSPNLRSSAGLGAVLLTAGLAIGWLGGDIAPADAALEVRVRGRDFRWHFTLPGPDARFGTADDVRHVGGLTLPQGQRVNFEITSEDYLYAFRAPALGLLEMAMPGVTFRASLVPERAGRFELEMDPMCAVPFAHESDLMGWLEIAGEPRG